MELGYTQEMYAQQMIDEYKAAGIEPKKVYAQSFNLNDVLFWLENEPEFGAQGVFLDRRYELDPQDSTTWDPGMEALYNMGVNIIAPPMWMLLHVDENGKIVPSEYAKAASAAGLAIITWTFERTDLRDGGMSDWYYQTIEHVVEKDGDKMEVLDVLAQQVGVMGVFSDWPAAVTFYANCMGIE